MRGRRGEQDDVRTGLLLVAVLALLTALWGAFLVPLRVAGVPLPVSVLLAGAANLALGVTGGRLAGRVGAALPGLLWFAVVLVLQTRRPEGDLIIPGTVTGLLFLVVGSLSAAVAMGLAPPRRRDAPAPPPRPRDARAPLPPTSSGAVGPVLGRRRS